MAYFKHRTLTDTSISWPCVLSKCNGRVRTFQENVTIKNDHSHFPDPAYVSKRKFRTVLKTRAVVADDYSCFTIRSTFSNNSFRPKRYQQRDSSSNLELFGRPEDRYQKKTGKTNPFLKLILTARLLKAAIVSFFLTLDLMIPSE